MPSARYSADDISAKFFVCDASKVAASPRLDGQREISAPSALYPPEPAVDRGSELKFTGTYGVSVVARVSTYACISLTQGTVASTSLPAALSTLRRLDSSR